MKEEGIFVLQIRKGELGRLCKFWLEPKIELFYNYGFTLNEIEALILKHEKESDNQLDLFHNGKRTTSKKNKRINKREPEIIDQIRIRKITFPENKLFCSRIMEK